MSLVLDCSSTLAFLLPDEITTASQTILDKIVATGAFVPSLWHLEVANSLTMIARRGRISHAFRNAALEDLAQLDIHIDTAADDAAWKATLTLADQFNLLYDAAYLKLAKRRHIPLATLNTALLVAAQATGVEIF